MAIVQFEKFNLNTFYEKTPLPLKYILVVSLIIVGSYFLFSKKMTANKVEQIAKIEQSIESTQGLIVKFDEFRTAQYVYNAEILDNLKDLYTLVEELNENTNRKFDLILSSGGKNSSEIVEKLILLNETFEKLQKAYSPEEIKPAQNEYVEPSFPISEKEKLKIGAKKIEPN
jgi:hypothetical protein